MFAALPFITCTITEKKPVPVPSGFDWQGHRGCRGLLPENSLPAFLHALGYPGVQTLELDLAVSKDGQLIVSHEPWFNPAICRKPGGDSISKKEGERYLLYQMSAAEIREFDCGSMGHPKFPEQQPMPVYKPTFREVVEAVRTQYPDKKVRWNLEIKSQPDWDSIRTPPVRDFARLVVNTIRELGLADQVTVQSFDVRAVQEVHAAGPELQLALLVANPKGLQANLRALGFKPAIYSPYYLLVDRKLIHTCHAQGIRIVPWTVNSVPAMRRLIRLGVDGIITDYPNKIAEVSAK